MRGAYKLCTGKPECPVEPTQDNNNDPWAWKESCGSVYFEGDIGC